MLTKLFAVYNRRSCGRCGEWFPCSLQTDTSLAIEAKFMKRWEFDSIAQAAEHISSWFPGTHGDRHLLKEYLDSVIGIPFHLMIPILLEKLFYLFLYLL